MHNIKEDLYSFTVLFKEIQEISLQNDKLYKKKVTNKEILYSFLIQNNHEFKNCYIIIYSQIPFDYQKNNL